jgi:hypothetical protein
MIASTTHQPPHASKAQQAERAFLDMLKAASERGFYGTTSLVLVVQDGHIQNLRVSVERVIK